MAFTQAQHDALEAAIAEGAMEVQYEDRRVRYQSRNQMLATLHDIKRALGQTPKGPLRVVVSTRRGYHPAKRSSSFDGSQPLDL